MFNDELKLHDLTMISHVLVPILILPMKHGSNETVLSAPDVSQLMLKGWFPQSGWIKHFPSFHRWGPCMESLLLFSVLRVMLCSQLHR